MRARGEGFLFGDGGERGKCWRRQGSERGGGSMEGLLADRLFGGFLFFFSGEGEEFSRAQMVRIWYFGTDRSRRAWSTYVGERPGTSFPSAAFARVCAMVDSRDLVFCFYLAVRRMLLRRDTSFRPGRLFLPWRVS